jgi:hypothetical protein
MPPGQAKKQERQQQQAYIPSPVYQDRGRGNGKGNGRGRGKGNNQQMVIPWNSEAWNARNGGGNGRGGGFIPPGQIRSQEVHERNAIRKAERDQQRIFEQQYQQPYYAPYYSTPSYRYSQPYYDQQYGYSTGYYPAPFYPSYQYYVQQYAPAPYVYSSGGYLAYSPIYVPNTFVYAPYTAYALYPDYYNYGYVDPYYANYGYNNGGFDWKSLLVRTLIGFVLGNDNQDYYGLQPYDPYYGYAPAVYTSGGYSPYTYYPQSYTQIEYVQPVYDYQGYQAPLVNFLPMDALLGPSYGGYASDTYREVLAQGYEQGYQAGWYARDNELANIYEDSSYRIDDDYYDPYAYSIGENRRCFSEGYALGYQDAMNGRQDYISNYGGNTDLVSLLLSNVIGNV